MLESNDSQKIAEIKSESELQAKVIQELLPDMSDPVCVKQLDKKINSSSGEIKQLWLATKDLCNKNPYAAEERFVKYLPELAKKLPDYSRRHDPALDSDIHNIRVFAGACELLTRRYSIADMVFSRIGKEDGLKCDEIFSKLGMLAKGDLQTRKSLNKQLNYQYKLMYIACTGEELAVVGEALTKQRAKNPQLLAVMESNREKLRILINRNMTNLQAVSYKDH